MIKKSLLIWLSIIPLAILSGIFREKILVPLIGKYAFPVDGIILCALIFMVALIFIPRLGKGTKRIYVLIGLLWFVLTNCFDLIFGLLVEGISFCELMKMYDITTGNLWSIIVLFTGIVPWLIAKMKKII